MPPRNLNPQKPRDARRTLAVLGRYLMKSAPMLAAALLLTVVSNVFQLIGPTLCGYAIDAIALESGVDFQSVFHYAALMLALYVASAAIGYAVTILILHVSQRTVRAMRADLFAKLMRLPVGYFDRNQTGDILSHISYDIDTVNTSLSNDLVQILTSLITVAGALIMMIRISPVLVLVFAVTVPVSVLFTKYMTGRVRPLYRERSRKIGELNGFVEEYVSGQKTIRAYRREDDVLGRFDRKNEDAVQSYYPLRILRQRHRPVGQLHQQPVADADQHLRRAAVPRGRHLAGRHLVVRAVFAQVLRPDQRGCEHLKRAAVGARRGGARVLAAQRRRGAGRCARRAEAARDRRRRGARARRFRLRSRPAGCCATSACAPSRAAWSPSSARPARARRRWSTC